MGKIHNYVVLTGATLGIAAAAPASAAITTLDFAGNICGPAGDQVCGNGSQIGQNYGDGVGVDVAYRSLAGGSGTTLEPFLKHWGPNYGDLANVVWGGGSAADGAEITFAALAGYELRLLSFDAGCYLNRTTCRRFPFSITEIGGALVGNGMAVPPANGHSSHSFNLAFSSTGYVLNWGPDGYDGGLDNIRFEVRKLNMGAVPEPSTWAMLILGFGLVGGAMRRRTALRYAAA